MSTLFLIPARGGSKGIPDKNLQELAGMPLVGWAVRRASRARHLLGGSGRVVCSTDDERIAKAAGDWGAEVPFRRPPGLASDQAEMGGVIRHALDELKADFEEVVLVQPTSPLCQAGDILEAVKLFRTSGDPVVSVCRNPHPVEWSFVLDPQSLLVAVLEGPEKGPLPARRQQASPTFALNGAVYVSSPAHFDQHAGFVVPGKTRGLVMDPMRSIDIDTPADLIQAQTLLASREIAPFGIGGRQIGPGHPCLVVAEAGVNHNGDPQMAHQMVDAAADCEADAIKFQTFRAAEVASAAAPLADYQKRTGSPDQLSLLRGLELAPQALESLMKHCRERNILFLSSPFGPQSADLLDRLGVPAFKVASGEITNLALLSRMAGFGKPVLLSTGMSSMLEVARALDTLDRAGSPDCALFHCVSSYPADPGDCNLAAMDNLRAAFGVPTGWSDHTRDNQVAWAAVARGANLLEKHFTLDRSLPGPDQEMSLEPGPLKALIAGVRDIERAIGDGRKRRRPAEEELSRVARRSLHAARPIQAGQVLKAGDLLALRPGTGIPADAQDRLIGRRATREIAEGEMISEDDTE